MRIRDRHEGQWRDRLAQVGGAGSNWDDFMFWTALQALLSPERIVDEGSGKLCYTTPVILTDGDMMPVVEFEPTIVIATNNRHVITAFPGGGC